MAKKAKDIQYYETVGRRKEAVARVRLYIPGKDKTVTVGTKKLSVGDIVVNDTPINKVFSSKSEEQQYLSPFTLTNSLGRFVTTIVVKGGGKAGQLEAVIHGISRGLVLVDKDENRSILKENDLLRRDSRTRERRMVGTGGKSRRQKQSPKR
jgi:small subunit ribosomal protein S9